MLSGDLIARITSDLRKRRRQDLTARGPDDSTGPRHANTGGDANQERFLEWSLGRRASLRMSVQVASRRALCVLDAMCAVLGPPQGAATPPASLLAATMAHVEGPSGALVVCIGAAPPADGTPLRPSRRWLAGVRDGAVAEDPKRLAGRRALLVGHLLAQALQAPTASAGGPVESLTFAVVPTLQAVAAVSAAIGPANTAVEAMTVVRAMALRTAAASRAYPPAEAVRGARSAGAATHAPTFVRLQCEAVLCVALEQCLRILRPSDRCEQALAQSASVAARVLQCALEATTFPMLAAQWEHACGFPAGGSWTLHASTASAPSADELCPPEGPVITEARVSRAAARKRQSDREKELLTGAQRQSTVRLVVSCPAARVPQELSYVVFRTVLTCDADGKQHDITEVVARSTVPTAALEVAGPAASRARWERVSKDAGFATYAHDTSAAPSPPEDEASGPDAWYVLSATHAVPPPLVSAEGVVLAPERAFLVQELFYALPIAPREGWSNAMPAMPDPTATAPPDGEPLLREAIVSDVGRPLEVFRVAARQALPALVEGHAGLDEHIFVRVTRSLQSFLRSASQAFQCVGPRVPPLGLCPHPYDVALLLQHQLAPALGRRAHGAAPLPPPVSRHIMAAAPATPSTAVDAIAFCVVAGQLPRSMHGHMGGSRTAPERRVLKLGSLVRSRPAAAALCECEPGTCPAVVAYDAFAAAADHACTAGGPPLDGDALAMLLELAAQTVLVRDHDYPPAEEPPQEAGPLPVAVAAFLWLRDKSVQSCAAL